MLDILDTAGQEEFSAMRDQYILSGQVGLIRKRTAPRRSSRSGSFLQGFIVVYSVASRDTFAAVSKFRDNIMRVKEDEKNVPWVLVGNKCDLVNER